MLQLKNATAIYTFRLLLLDITSQQLQDLLSECGSGINLVDIADNV
jgi:hypothetical protein